MRRQTFVTSADSLPRLDAAPPARGVTGSGLAEGDPALPAYRPISSSSLCRSARGWPGLIGRVTAVSGGLPPESLGGFVRPAPRTPRLVRKIQPAASPPTSPPRCPVQL